MIKTVGYLLHGSSPNNNNILYSFQREIKAVVRSYTWTHNEELNCTYLWIHASIIAVLFAQDIIYKRYKLRAVDDTFLEQI